MAALISQRYQYPRHYLTSERPEGEIEFLSAPMQTTPGVAEVAYGDRRLALETLDEVVVETIRLRSARFTARDTFDLAAVAEARPELDAPRPRDDLHISARSCMKTPIDAEPPSCPPCPMNVRD